MAIYRNISMDFWKDTKIVDEFTPEDKYFMLYCLTNPYTNLCGCYEISLKQMAIDTGYNEETISRLLDRFTNKHKVIAYSREDKELLIKNWSKYNWTSSNKLDKPLLSEIQKIKNPVFKQYVTDLFNKRDTVSIPYTYPSDTTVTDTVTVSDTDNTINNNKSNINLIIDFYNNNIGQLTQRGLEYLEAYLDDFGEDVIIYAMELAVKNNARTISYITAILDNWHKSDLHNLADIKNKSEKKKEVAKTSTQREYSKDFLDSLYAN